MEEIGTGITNEKQVRGWKILLDFSVMDGWMDGLKHELERE
jgi:hypothetical protein